MPAHPELDLGTLIGARGPSVHWGRLGLFAVALLLSGLVWVVLEPLTSGGGLLPARYWLNYVVANAVLIGAALVGFRLLGDDYLAALAVTVFYTVLMLPVSVFWAIPREVPDFWSVITRVSLFRITSTLTSLIGLAFALRLMRPLWLALGAGGLAANILQYLAIGPLIELAMDGGASLGGILKSLPWAVAEPVLFAGVYWVSLERSWVEAPLAGPAAALPVGFQRLSKGAYLGTIASCLGIALPLVLGGNALARSEPRTALNLLGFSVPFMLVGGVAFIVFVYRMWAAIQDGHARTTPGRAIGLLLVPFFNLYWAFQVLPGFAQDYNGLLVRRGLPLPPLPVGLYRAYVVLSITSVIPVVGLALMVVNYFVALALITRTCDAVNALPADLPADGLLDSPRS